MLKLKNYMESVVYDYLCSMYKEMDICDCEQCKTDILAIALNALPAKYVVTEKGESYSKTDLLVQQFEIDIITELAKAMKIVKNNPRHTV